MGFFGRAPCAGGAGVGAGGAVFSSSVGSSGFSPKTAPPSHPAQRERVCADAFGAAPTRPCMPERRVEDSQT